MKYLRPVLSILTMAALSAGILIYMENASTNQQQANTGIDNEGFIGKSEITVEDGHMTPETLLALGRLSDPEVSPDGKYILYGVSYTSVEDNRSVRNLYICNLDGSENQLLTKSGKSINNARWSADGKHIVFLMAGQIYSMAVSLADGKWSHGEACKISDVPAGVGEFKLSPDQK